MFLDHIHGYADKAYKAFDDKNMKGKLTAIDKIAHMIHMISTSESRCGALPADWDALHEMSEAWRNPKDVEYTADGDLKVHGVNISDLFNASITDFDAKNYEKVGFELGKASLLITHNGKLIDLGQDVSGKVDPKKAYFQKMGAEFAAGFFFGINVNGFDEKMIYDCLTLEPTAEGIFYNADLELKKALQSGDPSMAIKGFDDMVRFIYDLAAEGSNG
jgi:hypothetical protein